MATLNKDRVEYIESVSADMLREVFGPDLSSVSLPINLNKILEHYKLKLKQGLFKDPNISGAYHKLTKTIYISESETPQRQNFTTAHELGHYKLHKNKEFDVLLREIVQNLGITHSEEETEANWFAASLLMPRELVEDLWPAIRDTNKLAEFFGVSASAVAWRLKNLGIISNK